MTGDETGDPSAAPLPAPRVMSPEERAKSERRAIAIELAQEGIERVAAANGVAARHLGQSDIVAAQIVAVLEALGVISFEPTSRVLVTET